MKMILESLTTDPIVIIILIPKNFEVKRIFVNIFGSIRSVEQYPSIQRSLIYFLKRNNNKGFMKMIFFFNFQIKINLKNFQKLKYKFSMKSKMNFQRWILR